MAANSDQLPTEEDPNIDQLCVSFRQMLRKIDGDVETLSVIQSILSNEIDSVSSCDGDGTLFLSTADLPDASTLDLLPSSQCSAFVNTNELFSDLSEGASSKQLSDVSEENLACEVVGDVDDASEEVNDHNDVGHAKPALSKADLNQYVGFVGAMFPPSKITELDIISELEDIYSVAGSGRKYMWLTDTNVPYKFGHRTYIPKKLSGCRGIKSLMDLINKNTALQFDSCLVVRYVDGHEALSLHQDNESILDGNHPIVVTTIGDPRDIEFWSSKKECEGQLVRRLTPMEGDLLIMEKGCQKMLWHKVLPSNSPDCQRFALSFRKLAVAPETCNIKDSSVLTSTPARTTLKFLPNGFQVHPDRCLPPVSNEATPIRRSSFPSLPPPPHPPTPPPPPPRTTTSHLPPPPSAEPPFEVTLPPALLSDSPTLTPRPPSRPSQHHIQTVAINASSSRALSTDLVIGDSMVKGVRLPGSICICKGGIKPDELLNMLPDHAHILPRDHYSNIRSVTVVVGTNALNVNRPGQGIPFLKVVSDYERLINELRALFPNARLGLYNVLPRAFTCSETIYRIKDFNNVFQDHVVNRMRNVFWINHFREFLDSDGYIRNDLFGYSGVHLRPKGKGMLARRIKNFQAAYK